MNADGRLDRYYVISSLQFTFQQVLAEEMTKEKFRIVPAGEAKGLWNAAVAQLPKTFTQKVNLITGTILPVWDRLGGVSRIARAQTDASERVLGVIVSESKLPDILKNFGASLDRQISADEGVAAVLNGATARLSNGWRIMSRRVAGETRMDLLGPDHTNHELTKKGVILERVQFKMRYFIPTGSDAARILESIIRSKPIVELQGGARFSLESPGYSGNVPFRYASRDSSYDAIIRSLGGELAARFGPQFGEESLRWVEPDISNPSIATQVGLGEASRRLAGQLFGTEILFVDSGARWGGVVLPQHRNAIILNIQARNPWATVLGHELMERIHLLMDESQFRSVLATELQNFSTYKYILDSITEIDNPDPLVLDEFISDLLGYEFQNPSFWQKLIERDNRFGPLARSILQNLSGIRPVRSFETARFIRNANRVTDAMADLVATFVQQSRSQMSSDDEGARFMVERAPFESRGQLQLTFEESRQLAYERARAKN